MSDRQIHAFTIATAVMAATLLCTVVFKTTRLIGTVFPSFSVVETGKFYSPTLPNWLEIRPSGITHHEVLAVNDLPIQSVDTIYDFVASYPADTPIRYTLRLEDGTSVNRTIRSRRFSATDYAVLFGANLLTGFTFLLVGLSMAWRNPHSAPSFGLLSIGLTAGVFCLTGSDIDAPDWLVRLHNAAGILIPASVLHLGLVFPVDRIHKRPTLALTVVYVPWLIMAFVDALLFRALSEFSALITITHSMHSAALLLLLAILSYDFLSTPSQLVRRRIAIITIGSLTVLFLPTLLMAASAPLGMTMAFNGTGTTTFLVPLVIAYAAIKNDLFEMDLMLRRIVTLIALLISVIALSSIAILTFNSDPQRHVLIHSPVAITSLAVITLTLLGFVRSQFQQTLENWSDPVDYDGEAALTDLSDRLARAHAVASVLKEAGKLFTEIFAPEKTLPFLRDEDGRIWLQGTHKERKEIHLPEHMNERLHNGEVLTRYEWEDGSGRPIPHLWKELGVDLLLPVRGDPLFGILALGKKDSGRTYAAKDIRFLKAAGNQLALGLTKAALFDQMEQDAGISAALIRAQNEIAFSLNAPDILVRLCQITAEVLELECSHTLLWDTAQEAFIPVSAYGDTPEQAEELNHVRIPRAILGSLIEELGSQDAILTRRDPTRHHMLADMFHYRHSSTVIMPLRREGEIIGLHLAGCRSHSPQLTTRHERIARGIGHVSSMALANAYLMEELASASSVKSDFVASMSHELRTPLNHIIGYNDLMIDGAFGEISAEQRDTLQRVRRSSHNLLDLIEATLNLSRLDAKKIVVDERDVDLPSLVAELADRLEHSCKKPGVAVEWKIRPEVSSLRTDPIKLQMVLKNLVENAVKFTAAGRVVTHIRQRGGGIEFEVSDTGAGIPKDQQTAIFEPFRRVHDPTATPGVGLGLHIVRRLVDLMKGTITVESEVDLGSCFRVWLPFDPSKSPEPQVESPRIAQAKAATSPIAY